jgi:hypothetical protein
MVTVLFATLAVLIHIAPHHGTEDRLAAQEKQERERGEYAVIYADAERVRNWMCG